MCYVLKYVSITIHTTFLLREIIYDKVYFFRIISVCVYIYIYNWRCILGLSLIVAKQADKNLVPQDGLMYEMKTFFSYLYNETNVMHYLSSL
jgi:hypothetical protein